MTPCGTGAAVVCSAREFAARASAFRSQMPGDMETKTAHLSARRLASRIEPWAYSVLRLTSLGQGPR